MNRWLNFAGIKQSVALAAVLEQYQWKCLRQRGDRAEGRCPIHRGQREDAFHADLRNNGFHCFSCHAHGSVLDLVAAMEGCTLRQAALLLQHWFGIRQSQALSGRSLCQQPKEELIREKETATVPLRFSLQPVDVRHAYLKQRGIHEDTAAHFRVGYYSGPGLLHGRVVIPIHDECGRLLAYAGRSVGTASDTAGPKYRLPPGFRKIQRAVQPAPNRGSQPGFGHRGGRILRLSEGPSGWSALRRRANGVLAVWSAGGAAVKALSQPHADA
jgi:hypothetical protein